MIFIFYFCKIIYFLSFWRLWGRYKNSKKLHFNSLLFVSVVSNLMMLWFFASLFLHQTLYTCLIRDCGLSSQISISIITITGDHNDHYENSNWHHQWKVFFVPSSVTTICEADADDGDNGNEKHWMLGAFAERSKGKRYCHLSQDAFYVFTTLVPTKTEEVTFTNVIYQILFISTWHFLPLFSFFTLICALSGPIRPISLLTSPTSF